MLSIPRRLQYESHEDQPDSFLGKIYRLISVFLSLSIPLLCPLTSYLSATQSPYPLSSLYLCPLSLLSPLSSSGSLTLSTPLHSLILPTFVPFVPLAPSRASIVQFKVTWYKRAHLSSIPILSLLLRTRFHPRRLFPLSYRSPRWLPK